MNLALLAAAAAGVQVGVATVASRFVLAEVAPLTLAMLRYAIGLVCLLPFLLVAMLRHPRPAPGAAHANSTRGFVAIDWVVMALLGIGQFGILVAALNYGLQFVSAVRAALIFSLFPLLTVMLSSALGYERVTPALLGGVLISIFGVSLALWPSLSAPGQRHWVGELAVLASALVGAICSVLFRPYLQRYPTLQVSTFSMLASVLFLGIAALPEAWPSHLGTLRVQVWAVVIFIGFSSALGYLAWLYALKHEPATRVTVFLALNPLTAAVLGQLLLAEVVDRWTVAGTGFVVLGLWLVNRKERGGAQG